MKYIQFGIMAVLMLSLALSPALSGLAFAVETEPETRASDKTEPRDSEDKPADRDPTGEQKASDKDLDREGDLRTGTEPECSHSQDSNPDECPKP